MHPVMKVMAKVHAAVYQLSGGRMGRSMGGQDILLLHHVGAKSGKAYKTPLGYVRDGDAYAVIAAAAGQPNHPRWYHNLKKNPSTTINIEGNEIRVVAEIAPKEKRDELWAKLSAELPQFDEFQAKTERVIPAVLLRPLTTGFGNYTEERRELMEEQTMDEALSDLRAYQSTRAPKPQDLPFAPSS